MELNTLLYGIASGIVEGITEFLPVSSTGHLLLLREWLQFDDVPGNLFEVTIQLGAIIALCWHYRSLLTRTLVTLPKSKDAQYFTKLMAIALVPLLLGPFIVDGIKSLLFNTTVIATNLIVGGLLILLIEKKLLPKIKHKNPEKLPLLTGFKIGCCQLLALVPGVSRSGATIMGGMLFGLERKAATEFSFLLAIPTLLAATAYDFYKSYEIISSDHMPILLVGFISAFLTALCTVRILLNFISNHSFELFGYYRIIIGLIVLVSL